ncbi:MAG: glycosyltransferase family 61 protein [Candidatus Limnocylindrales bacterium]
MRVDFDRLRCASVFEGDEVVIHPFTARAGANIRIAEVQDVLYLPNVLEAGQSVCIFDDEIVPEESVLFPDTVDFLKSVRARHPASSSSYSGEFEVDRISAPVCILGNLFSRNFGHWTEELLKVVILESSGLHCQYVMSTLPPFARESLILLGIEEARIRQVDVPTLFDRVLFTTAIHHDSVHLHPDALYLLRTLVESRVTGQSAFGPRVWLERGAMLNNGGVTLNRDEVGAVIAKFGFESVDMAALPVADQLRAMRGATLIAGPHGASFVHAQFMPPRSAVVECFSPKYVNPSILQICRVLQHRYHQVVSPVNYVAPYTHGRNILIDCRHLELVLDSLAW